MLLKMQPSNLTSKKDTAVEKSKVLKSLELATHPLKRSIFIPLVQVGLDS